MSLLPINSQKEIETIVNFLKKTFYSQKINKVVIGLSGGIDSTTSYYLLQKALPEKNIIAVHLSYQKYTSEVYLELKKNVISISIKKPVDEIAKEVKLDARNWKLDLEARDLKLKNPTSNFQPQNLTSRFQHPASNQKIRLGNIIARVRMIILFDLAKKHNALVCGTENKSERLLGYFTRFGDAASDIEPIQRLYKTQVIQLAKYLDVPQKIINQKPTAGLWQGQTDEDEFGFTYEEADNVLSLYFDKKMSTEKIVKMGYRNAKKITDFVKKNEFKRKTPYTLY